MIKRLSIMLRVDDTAHASIALTPERTFYRFATDDSIEDGEMGPVADFAETAATIADAAIPLEGETPLPSDVRMQVFADNVLMRHKPSVESLRRVVGLLAPLFPEFGFVETFKA